MNSSPTSRYQRKRQALLAAASAILNRKGAAGMTLAEVGAAVGFTTTSVTYYFRRKEDLAAACIIDSVERLDAMIGRAGGEPTPDGRVRRLLDDWLAEQFSIDTGQAPARARFNDIRALGEPQQGEVMARFNAMFRRLRGLMETNGAPAPRRVMNARANLLLEQLLWSVVWLPRYDPEDRDRVGARMFDILQNGLAPPGAAWDPPPLPPLQDEEETPATTFLKAATRLINQQGYRGASVEKIAASLKVTKGSFYHHVEAKDDLVAACFERTYATMERVQRASVRQGGTKYEALSMAAADLVARQLTDAGPLLRSSALSVVPEPIRNLTLKRAQRVTDRFAAMIADGMLDGSVRPVDPAIAAQMIHGAINAVADLPQLAPTLGPAEAMDLYARPMLTGLLRASAQK